MKPTYAVTGVTGQVGGAVAQELLHTGCEVRAVVRNGGKGKPWTDRGCSLAVAEMNDHAALTEAFRNAAGVFVLLPPNFDPDPSFSGPRALISSLRTALSAAAPERIVALSTIGAQAAEGTILKALSYLEEALGSLPGSVTFLRAAWFMENSVWDIPSAREQGVIRSFLQPADKPVPMVATADVGRTAAKLLRQNESPRIVELEGPRRITPNDIAGIFSRLLRRQIRTETVPRASWEAAFKSQGASAPQLRARMLDGFNEGWIEFEQAPSRVLKGAIEMEAVLRSLIGAEEHTTPSFPGTDTAIPT